MQKFISQLVVLLLVISSFGTALNVKAEAEDDVNPPDVPPADDVVNYIEIPVSELVYEVIDDEVIIQGYKGEGYTHISIPDEIEGVHVTQIAPYAFAGRPLVGVKLPTHLKIVGEYAFVANQLTEVIFNDELEVIEGFAFQGNALTHIKLSNLKSIGVSALSYNPQLTNIVLTNIEEIGDAAFLNSSLPTLTTDSQLVLNNIGKIGVNSFEHFVANTVTLNNIGNIAEFGFVGGFAHSLNWEGATDTVGQFAFSGAILSNVLIAADINHVDDSAFKFSSDQVKVTGTIDFLGRFAFSNMDSPIGYLEITGDILVVGEYAFSNLPNVHITGKLIELERYAFGYIANLTVNLEHTKIMQGFTFSNTRVQDVDLKSIESMGIGEFNSAHIDRLILPIHLTELPEPFLYDTYVSCLIAPAETYTMGYYSTYIKNVNAPIGTTAMKVYTPENSNLPAAFLANLLDPTATHGVTTLEDAGIHVFDISLAGDCVNPIEPKGSVTINYVDELGTLLETETLTEQVYGTYTANAKSLDGYLLVSDETKLYTISEDDIHPEIEFSYQAIAPTEPPVEPTNPVEPPVVPTEPTEPPVEPTNPVEPPVVPTEPTEPPVEPTNPVEPPVVPTEPPVEPTNPVEPPVAPTEPTEPPVEPTNPVEPPVAPTEPTEPPVEPTEPIVPTGSVTITYVDLLGNVLETETNVGLPYGTYTAHAKSMKGYLLVSEPLKLYTISSNALHHEIEFIYHENVKPPTPPIGNLPSIPQPFVGKITIRMVDENETLLNTQIEVKFTPGVHQVVAPQWKDYVILGENIKTVTLTHSQPDAIVTFVYKQEKSDSDVIENEKMCTLAFEDELYLTKESKGNVFSNGKNFSVDASQFKGDAYKIHFASTGELYTITLYKQVQGTWKVVTDYQTYKYITMYSKCFEDKVFLRHVNQIKQTAIPHTTTDTTVRLALLKNETLIFYKKEYPFLDIAKTNEIQSLRNRQVVYGTSYRSFDPTAELTRAQTAAVISRALGLDSKKIAPFTDTKTHWATHYIANLVDAAIFQGHPSTTFNPMQAITVKQLHVAINRTAYFVNGSSITYNDYFKGLAPNATITREQAVPIFYAVFAELEMLN